MLKLSFSDFLITQHKALAKPFERFFAKLLKPRQNDSSGHKYSWEGNHEASKMVEEFQVGSDHRSGPVVEGPHVSSDVI